MDPIPLMDISDLARSFLEKELTPTEVLESTIAHIREVEPRVNCLSELAFESARRAASESDERWRKGVPLSALDGVPVTVKDSINVAGLHWRHGSSAHSGLSGARHDAPPAARLREAGAIIVAKTTMPDMGMLAAGVSSLYGITRNPWDLSANPGGSSAGAGAGLACGIGYAAVGTDIAGSVRIPAGLCGLAALKPTQGRIAHTPSSSMRSAGPMARRVSDLRSIYDVLAKPDTQDVLCLPARETVGQQWCDDLTGMRIGLLEDMGYGANPDKEVLKVVHMAAEELRSGGAHVESVGTAFSYDPYSALDRIFQVRAWTELLSVEPNLRRKVEPHVAAWAEGAKDIDAVSYQNDLSRVSLSAVELAESLSKFDAVLSPVFPRVRFPAEAVGLNQEKPLEDCSFTCWFNQSGQPSGSVCFGFHNETPVGVQIVAARFHDDLVMNLCEWLESRRNFKIEWPIVPK